MPIRVQAFEKRAVVATILGGGRDDGSGELLVISSEDETAYVWAKKDSYFGFRKLRG